jgi:hypothetical protein
MHQPHDLGTISTTWISCGSQQGISVMALGGELKQGEIYFQVYLSKAHSASMSTMKILWAIGYPIKGGFHTLANLSTVNSAKATSSLHHVKLERYYSFTDHIIVSPNRL